AEGEFRRDPLGRVLAETCNGRTVTSRYDLLGRRVYRRTPSGAETTWDYDPNSQPVRLHTAGHTVRFGYDAAGREVARRIGDGALLTQTWDAGHRLRSQPLPAGGLDPGAPAQPRVVQHRGYQYRPDGQLTGLEDQLNGPRRYDLDPAGRVTAVHGTGWVERYGYDPAGHPSPAPRPGPHGRQPRSPGE